MRRSINTDVFGNRLYLYDDDNLAYFKNPNYFNDDPDLIEFLYKTIKKNWVVFDVGAMRGYITVLAGNSVGKGGRIYSFEPECKNYERLLENIALNNLKNVTSNKLAVNEKDGKLTLNIFSEKGWHSLGLPIIAGVELKPISKQKISGTSLDNYCEIHNIRHINLLKIDVEGAEKSVFDGCKSLMRQKAIDIIVFEVSMNPLKGMNTTPRDLYKLLTELNYEIYHLDKTSETGIKKIVGEQSMNVEFENFIALPKTT